MEDHNSLFQPLLSIVTTTTSCSSFSSAIISVAATNNTCSYSTNKAGLSSNKSVIIRLLLVMSVAAISLWANYEASKTFDITLINDARDSPSGRRFDLFYVSNDRATRVLLNASSFVQNLLYDPHHHHQYPKKHIRHVTLRLAGRNLNSTASVTGKHDSGAGAGDYVIDLSPSLLEEANYGEAIAAAVLRAMVRVWFGESSGGSRAPARLIDGVVEYVAAMAGFGGGEVSVSGAGKGSPERADGDWWEDKEPSDVARFLRCCEGYKEGFIRRLNEAMRDTWHDRIVDDALGMPAKKLCGFYNASWASHNNTVLLGSM